MTVPSHLSAMPSRTADLDETWRFLKRGLDHTMIHGNVPFQDYTILYTMVYNYCTSSKTYGRTDGNRSTLLVRVAPHHSANFVSTAGANLVGSDLYSKLSAYCIEHFKPIIAVGIVL